MLRSPASTKECFMSKSAENEDWILTLRVFIKYNL